MTQLYLYLLTPKRRNFPGFSKAIVVASNEDAAKNIHPLGDEWAYWDRSAYWYCGDSLNHEWPSPTMLNVVRLGIADNPSYKEGDVLCKERS